MATSSSSRRPRSSPIAIVRPGEEPSRRKSIDSDDDDDFCIEGGVNALSLGTSYVGSVPTKPRGIRRRPKHPSDLSRSLPGAPMLASRSFEMRKDSLPPISLTDNVESSHELPSYGSLRDSHQEGKFLDGPASYRDRSGQIHALRHNQAVRLDDSATSYNPPLHAMQQQQQHPVLLPPQNTVAERLMAASSSDNNKKPSARTASATTNTSSLSSMMQGNLPPQAMTTTILRQEDHTSSSLAADDSMLSTSLTGLEILQSARGRTFLPGPASMPSFLPNGGVPPPPPVAIEPLAATDDDDEEDLFELDME